jgi:hypothetical protein
MSSRLQRFNLTDLLAGANKARSLGHVQNINQAVAASVLLKNDISAVNPLSNPSTIC